MLSGKFVETTQVCAGVPASYDAAVALELRRELMVVQAASIITRPAA
ncbi:MAG: hypothetical protein NTY63_03530 [Candidatus Bipolaricaulota bacterium]|nr:hypothetical protein [Candidatus Bipolaricaulota bacterium]